MRSSRFTVIYDACVLYPAPLRDFLMWLGLSGRFRARWSSRIHEEWQRSLLKKRAELSREQLQRTVELMNAAIPDATVEGYDDLIAGLNLPDANDRHVLAAAIRCNASIIVTFNEKDFPVEVLSRFGIETQHPDAFVDDLFDLDAACVIHAAQRQRRQLKHPPMDVERYLNILLKQGLVQTCRALAPFKSIL